MNAPPSINLAVMSMQLAEQRVAGSDWRLTGFWTRHKIPPCDRVHLNPAIHPVSTEYYRIIDRISAGEAP